MASFKESEKDILENIDTDSLTLPTEKLPTNDDDNYVRDSSNTKHDVKNFDGSDFDVTTTNRSHSEKHTSSNTTSKSTGGYKVKSADEEVEDALRAARSERSGPGVADKAKEAKDDVSYKARETEDYVSGKATETKDAVKDTAGDIKGEADRAAGAHQPRVDEAKDEAGQQWGHTQKKAGEFAGSVQDSAGAAGNVVKEKAGQVKDTVGLAFGATKVKADEASGYDVHGKTAHDATGEAKEGAKGLLGGFQNILGEASKTIQDTVNAPGENVNKH